MNNLKKLYETPNVEEIVFTSMDAIALSEDTDPTDDVVVDGDNIWS